MAQQVTLACDTSGAQIYYTTDGTVPTQSSALYNAPVSVSQTGMIRAKAFKDGDLDSATYTATYIINDPHTLPVISLVADPDDLYSYDKGIFAMGPNASAEFPYQGANFWQDWEVPAHIEILENGQVAFGQDIGLKVFGAYSRAIEQKGLAIFARSRFGESMIDCALFPDQSYTAYKSIVLRSSGQDGQYTKIRDVLQTSLMEDANMNISLMDYQTYVLYINGQYRGVYYMREKINKYYFAQHFDIEDPDSIDLLVGNGTATVGDNDDYLDLVEYCKTHSLDNQENFDYVASQIDTDSYMDFLHCRDILQQLRLG